MKRSKVGRRRFAERIGLARACRGILADPVKSEYQRRLKQEQSIYADVRDINLLPEIFHYWSNHYLRPMLEELGISNPDQFFAKHLKDSANVCGEIEPVFLSIGAGNCDTEVRVAILLKECGLTGFVIECMDINPAMLERGRQLAQAEGVEQHIRYRFGDFNDWRPEATYAGVMANQSLHHVVELEHLFASVKSALAPGAKFVVSDMIGRNGHLRWPEALDGVRRFWVELPSHYRYNHQLMRQEDIFEDWDCSGEGFEGIRAQDILPLLLSHFHFEVFIGFGNVIDPFVDRSFGHNFDANSPWDREFIDRVHAFDEEGLQTGVLTPAHMIAVLGVNPVDAPFYSRGLSPNRSCRRVLASSANVVRDLDGASASAS